MAYGKGGTRELVVRSLGGADDGAVEINVESDFVAFAVCEGVGAVEGGFDGRSDGVLGAGGGRVSKYGLLVSFLRFELGLGIEGDVYSFWALNMAWLEWTIVSVLVSLMEMLTWVLEGTNELASLALRNGGDLGAYFSS